MKHQLDPPKGSTWNEFVLQEPNGALSKTMEPHGAQACHRYKQVVLFGDARDMWHQLKTPQKGGDEVNSNPRKNAVLFQTQMSPMGHKPAIALGM